jgi:hypothetical protein
VTVIGVLLEGLAWVLGGAVVAGVGMVFGTEKGRTWARKKRGKAWGKVKKTSKAAWGYRQKKKAATPRGQRKAKRRTQPPRMTVGHVRAPDDPHPARRAARWVGGKAKEANDKRKLNKLRKKGQPPKRQPIGQLVTKSVFAAASGPKPKKVSVRTTQPQGQGAEHCQAHNQDGTQCGNLERIIDGVGVGYCYITKHKNEVLDRADGRRRAAQQDARMSKAGQADARRAADAERAERAQKEAAKRYQAQQAAASQRRHTPRPKPAPAGPSRVDSGSAPRPAPTPKPATGAGSTRNDEQKGLGFAAKSRTRTTRNVASSGFTPVQVGQQVSGQEAREIRDRVMGGPTKPATPKAKPTTSGNHASPGARVGMQANNIVGNVHVTQAGRDVNTGSTVNHFSGDAMVTGKGGKPAKPQVKGPRDVDQSVNITKVAGKIVSTDGTLNITRKGD